MAMTEEILLFYVASVVEDVLQKHGTSRLSDTNFASTRAEESSLGRYEVAGWLRKMAGVVGGKDLSAESSEEAFSMDCKV